MNAERRDIEREIGRVLQGLSEVEAPLGLEGRVLVHIAEARAQRSVGRPRGLMLAATCLLVAVVWVSFHGHGGDRSANVATVQRPHAGEHAAVVGIAGGGGRVEARPVPLHAKGRALAVRNEAGAGLSADEALALEEMRAPSRPEAPRPLTGQEQMLVRVAQGRGAEALARAEVSDEVQEGVEEGSSVVAAKDIRRRESAGNDAVSVLRAGLFAGMTTGSVANDE